MKPNLYSARLDRIERVLLSFTRRMDLLEASIDRILKHAVDTDARLEILASKEVSQ